MEEIQGTEVLEKEILDEAVKSADRMVRQAAAEVERATARTKAQLESELAGLKAEADAKSGRYADEVRSRLPLERTRIRAAFLDSAIRENLRAWIDSLDPESLARWCGARLAEGASSVAQGAWILRYRGFSGALAAKIAEGFPGALKPKLQEDSALRDRGVVAETEDGSVRLNATGIDLESALVEDRRGELAAALCPELVPIRAQAEER
ncbi:MAG: hypothetical protein WBH97_03255 [Rectinemataceae bacterium]